MLVMSKRRDIFRTACSHYITYQTQEWHDYTNQEPKPVWIDENDFIGTYLANKNWYKKIDLNYPFYKVTEIYYEDTLTDGYAVVKEQLEISNPGPPGEIKSPSPYNYKDWISNWEGLLIRIQQLEKGS
jgi:hypothetical protein